MKKKTLPTTIILVIFILLFNARSFAKGVSSPSVSQNNRYFGYETTIAPTGWGNPTLYFPNCASSFISRYHIINLNHVPANQNPIIAPLMIDEDTPISSLDMAITYQNKITSFEENDYSIAFESSSDGLTFSGSDFVEKEDGSFSYDDSPFKQYKLYINKKSYIPINNLSIQFIHNVDMINRLEKMKSSENQASPIIKIAYSSPHYPKIRRSTDNLEDKLNSSYEGSDPIYIANPSISGNVSYEKLQVTSNRPTGINTSPGAGIKISLIEKIESYEDMIASTTSDSNGNFIFSNIDEDMDNDFQIKDSKNQLILRIDDTDYNPWTFHNDLVEEMNDQTSNLGKITDISRYEFSDDKFNSLIDMDNFYWTEDFRELNPNGERAQNFKIILTDKETTPSKKGSVTLNYLDESGKQILSSEILEGLLGSPYNAPAKTIDNYRLSRIEGNNSGFFTDKNIVVNFIYKKSQGQGQVTVRHLSTGGNQLSSEEVLYGNIGSNYSTRSKSISGYRLKTVEGASESGQFINGNLIVKYIYERKTDTKDPKDPKPEQPKPPIEKPTPPTDSRGREIGKLLEPKVEYELNKKDHFAYIKGYTDNTVQPNGYITREEVAMVIYRLMEPEYRGEIETNNHNFTDIKKTSWSTRAVASLANGQILKGYEDQSFKPHANMTRAEIAKVIARFTDVKVFETQFPDIIGHWAEDYINTAQDAGWVQGYSDGGFKPNELLTRAEFVTMINSLLDRKVSKENALTNLKYFPDLTEEWYYEQMIEAINGHNYEDKRLDDGSEVWTNLVDTNFPDK